MTYKNPIKTSKISGICLLLALTTLCVTGCKNATENNNNGPSDKVSNFATPPSITQGRATQNIRNVFECDVPGWRVTATGTIQGADGQSWTVPAEVNYQTAAKATDLFNECTGVTLPNGASLDVSTVPIVEVDSDGEVITAYFFGDNYYEFYVNGKIIGVDPVPYWPFNTAAVRFKAKRPFVAGIKMIDWSENLGLGSELMRGVPFHTGDGGFVGIFKDNSGNVITTTDENWRVKPYYIAPLLDASCVKADRTSSSCEVPPKDKAEEAYGAHWKIPQDWGRVNFNDTDWKKATLYTNEEIGGSLNRPAYSNFTDLFDDPNNDATFIWSQNLLQDNVVLGRRIIE